MTERGFTYQQYPGGENDTIDGMTAAQLDELASLLRAQEVIRQDGETERLALQYLERDEPRSAELTLGQLAYILHGMEQLSPEQVVEQHRVRMLERFSAVTKPYSNDVFLPLLESLNVPAPQVVETDTGWWFGRKKQPIAPAPVEQKKSFYITPTVDDVAYEVNGEFYAADKKSLKSIVIALIQDGWSIRLDFSPEGTVTYVRLTGLANSWRADTENQIDLNTIERLRAEKTGKHGNVEGFSSVFQQEKLRTRAYSIRITPGYQPILEFANRQYQQLMSLTYDATDDMFVYVRNKEVKCRVASRDVAKMLEEALSVLPVQPLAIGVPLQNPDDLR